MDKIERAMGAIDGLPEPGRLRVRRWVAETWPDATAPADGAGGDG